MYLSILVIGAGESSLGMIRTIKKMGYKAAVVGMSDSELAISEADFYLQTQKENLDDVIKFAKTNHVIGLVPIPVDWILMWQAKVAEALELKFIPVSKVPNFRHKFTMKQVLQAAHIPCAKGIHITKDNFQSIDFTQFDFPLVVKPTDGYASRGVTVVKDSLELNQYLKEAFEFSIGGDIVIEEFIGGKEYNAEGVVFEGKVDFYAIIEKVSGAFPRTLEMGHLFPANINKAEEEIICQTVEKAVLALGMENGAFNTEIKIWNGKAYIIEVNGRLAGDFIVSHLIKPTTGRDMEAAVVNISIGKNPGFHKLSVQKHGYIAFFNLPEQKTIERIQTIPDLETDPDLIWWKIFYKENDITPEIKHMGHRAGFSIVTGESRNSVLEKAEYINQKLIKSITLK
ncbi:MAG: ATP-grasp domain-containing protein [Bacteroidales bacterium]|nr:ATP-grasp domain-containing protein [Bacteroidales bacterium]